MNFDFIMKYLQQLQTFVVCNKPSLLDKLDNLGQPVKKEDGYLYIALHKEFNKNHNVITTQFGCPVSFEECQKICNKINRNGFNYRPYKYEESITKRRMQIYLLQREGE